MQKISTLFVALILILGKLSAQYSADMVVGKKNLDTRDSMKTASYPYILPIWGQKATNKGFNLPYSAGLSMQYIYQQSDIIINNLQVGFNNGPMHNMDQIVRFDNSVATSNGLNIRPDFWILPFLNVYAIFAKSKTSTAINAGVYLPDSSDTWHRITDINTKAEFDATTFGFGLTPTIGIGGAFLALDMNFSWTDIDELDKPAYVFIFGPRLGKNFKLKKKDQNVAVWVGGFRVKMNSGTNGNISASELFPTDQWGEKVNTGLEKVADGQQKVDAWWEDLTPQEQKNPVNIAKYNTANNVLSRAGNFFNAASEIVSNAGNGSIQYSLDKKPKDKWNFIVGSQFQLNKSWMLRVEYGFLSSRQQFIGGLQYRFGL
ncbi:hypothetical protein [Flavihumibacter petaseus]|uniref:Outer membrane protein beta-barrel domain-containing protein n=1 Tax=Flavihumibacter petaseus NBRC 106054 TaxID=1220578 RepID=A0A0E9MUA8_9BACT|nr:hypothetical protein [Flavihumibacter petaseus]GAO40996.1 hypothetical protein FPE01S_01_00070 [Flavihumibacter petaseus NBRC 106054]